jgi:hypothetical protein
MNSQENNSFRVKHLQHGSVCDPAKLFLTSKFSYLLSFFPTSPIKLKLQIDGTLLSNSNPPGPIKTI